MTTRRLLLALGFAVLSLHCGSDPNANPDRKPDGGGAADGGTSDVGTGDAGTSGSDGGIVDETTCAPGTYEFPFRSGACIDDPCAPDPCGGAGTCSNVTGVAVCTRCTRFVDASGGADTNDGASTKTPWKSIAKVNAATLTAGDNVCFKRGETFVGTLQASSVGTSAMPLRYGHYGASELAKPLLTGHVPLGSWTQTVPGIWKASCPSCGSAVESVTIDGEPKAMGRTPNASAAGGGFLTYEGVLGPPGVDADGYYNTPYNGVLGITDNELPASPSWVGAEVVIRKTYWMLDRARVTAQNGPTIQYENPGKASGSVGRAGWGYFFQNSLQTLDEEGEWYYAPDTHEIYIYFGAKGPGARVVLASTVDTVVSFTASSSNVVVDGIRVTGGNGQGIFVNQAKNVTITSVDVAHSGRDGIRVSGTDGVTIQSSTVSHSGASGIFLAHTPKNTTVVHNVVRESGVVPGAGPRISETDQGNHQGILVSGSTAEQNTLIDTNVIDRTGYSGIHFVASGVHVKNNVVTRFEQILEDGGGVYTWRGSEVYTDRQIVGNVLLDGPGSPFGQKTPASPLAVCLYLDNASSNVVATDNTMARCSRASILENYAHDVTLSHNTSFDSNQQIEIWSLSNAPITQNTMTDNVFVSRKPDQLTMNLVSASGQLANFGTFDRNFYVRPFEDDLLIESLTGNVPNRHDLRSWQIFSGFDVNSKATPVILKAFGAPTNTAANLFAQGDFESGLGGVNFYSAGGNASMQLDTSSKLSGPNSLRVTFAQPLRQNCRISSLAANGTGPVSKAKVYMLKVSTLGTTDAGILSASITQRGSPYADLGPVQRRAFGKTRVDHTFYFSNLTDEAAATFSVSVEERSGTTYLDNLELREVAAPAQNVDASIRFEVNARTTPKVVPLDGDYLDAKGATQKGNLTLAPLSSVVLFKKP